MPIFDGIGNYIETAIERRNRMKLEISYQHTRDEKPYEYLNAVAVPALQTFYLGAAIRPSVLNAALDNIGSVVDSSVIFSEGSIFQTEVSFATPLTTPGQYKIDYHSGEVQTFSTPSGVGTVTFAWSPFPYYIIPDWYTFSDPLCMHVCPLCAHGNVSTLVTGTGVGFASSPFYGGTHPPIFVYTGFEPSCALAAFEKEYDTLDVEYIYYYQSIARAAHIRVGEIVENGFYIEFKQIEDAPWVLEFNWIATGCERATPDDPCDCCEGAGIPPQNTSIGQFDGRIVVDDDTVDELDGKLVVYIEDSDNSFDGRLEVCVTYCCIIYDSDYWENRMCPDSPLAISDTIVNNLLQRVRNLSTYFDNANLSNRVQACALLHNNAGDTILDKILRFYLTSLLNVAVGAMPLEVFVDSTHTTATDFEGVIADIESALGIYASSHTRRKDGGDDNSDDNDDNDDGGSGGNGGNEELERILALLIDIVLGDATMCLKINEESYRDEGDIDAPTGDDDDDDSSDSSDSGGEIAPQSDGPGLRRIALRVAHNYSTGPYITTVEAFRGNSTAINHRIDIEAATLVPSGAVDANPGGLSGNVAILYTQLDGLLFDLTAKVNGTKHYLPTSFTIRVTIQDSHGTTVYGPVTLYTSGSELPEVGMSFGPFEVIEIESLS